jgi:hypothetical protein
MSGCLFKCFMIFTSIVFGFKVEHYSVEEVSHSPLFSSFLQERLCRAAEMSHT